jgi:hypothetical protein
MNNDVSILLIVWIILTRLASDSLIKVVYFLFSTSLKLLSISALYLWSLPQGRFNATVLQSLRLQGIPPFRGTQKTCCISDLSSNTLCHVNSYTVNITQCCDVRISFRLLVTQAHMRKRSTLIAISVPLNAVHTKIFFLVIVETERSGARED